MFTRPFVNSLKKNSAQYFRTTKFARFFTSDDQSRNDDKNQSSSSKDDNENQSLLKPTSDDKNQSTNDIKIQSLLRNDDENPSLSESETDKKQSITTSPSTSTSTTNILINDDKLVAGDNLATIPKNTNKNRKQNLSTAASPEIRKNLAIDDHKEIISLGNGLEKPQGRIKEEKYFTSKDNQLLTAMCDHKKLKCENLIKNWKEYEKSLDCTSAYCPISHHKNILEETYFMNENNDSLKIFKEKVELNMKETYVNAKKTDLNPTNTIDIKKAAVVEEKPKEN